MRSYFVLTVIFLFLFVSGCGGQGIRHGYEELVWPKDLELEKESRLPPAQRVMAEAVYSMDERLSSLLQELDAFTVRAGEEEVKSIEREFPWLEGVAVITAQGEVRHAYPEGKVATFSWQELNEQSMQREERRLYALPLDQISPGLVFVLRPLYTGGQRWGTAVAYFRMDALVSLSPRSRELVVLRPDRVLWSGNYEEESRILADRAWQERLKSRVRGRIAAEGKEFFWVSRYIGQKPFIYLVEAPEGQENVDPRPVSAKGVK